MRQGRREWTHGGLEWTLVVHSGHWSPRVDTGVRSHVTLSTRLTSGGTDMLGVSVETRVSASPEI